MRQRTLALALATGIVACLLMLTVGSRQFHLPDNQQGYEPDQPIAFSHLVHAGDLAIDCQYCHSSAETSRHAGIPAAETCMNCHRFVTAPFGAAGAEDKAAEAENREPRQIVSPEIQKIYDALAVDVKNKLAPIEGREPKPIDWIKVHNLPDFVYFDHRAHVVAGVECQKCHGPVETMQRVRQVESLSMGWCVNCHREVNEQGLNGKTVNASTDCDACHH